MSSSLSTKHLGEDITRDQLELLKAKFDVLQGERKVSLFYLNITPFFVLFYPLTRISIHSLNSFPNNLGIF
jgi:hypothetical protein